jgi:hypothetical protein
MGRDQSLGLPVTGPGVRQLATPLRGVAWTWRSRADDGAAGGGAGRPAASPVYESSTCGPGAQERREPVTPGTGVTRQSGDDPALATTPRLATAVAACCDEHV